MNCNKKGIAIAIPFLYFPNIILTYGVAEYTSAFPIPKFFCKKWNQGPAGAPLMLSFF